MPPKNKKNVLIMIANTGTSSVEINSTAEEPFLNKAKYAMKLLVEKKIFMQPKDEIGIITMGDVTDNPENSDYIKLYNENLLIANWEMVKYINNLSATSYPCNWIEALHVALCFIRKEVIDPESRIFLVIFNNFKEDDESINKYESDAIVNDLINYDNLHLLFVGENAQSDFESPSEKFALSVIEQIQGQYEQLNDFIEARRFYFSPPSNAIPWKANLEWDGLNIPCATYTKVTEPVSSDTWKIQGTDTTSNLLNDDDDIMKDVVKTSIHMDRQRNEISPENIINGYKFGGKYIPVSEEDEIAMNYSGSTKGLKIYGFVPQNEVQLEYWSGLGSRIIVPTDDPVPFYSLLQAMAEKQYAAIVRKVYLDDHVPKMGILFPKIDDDEIWCLVHLELPYANDLRIIKKKPIKLLEEKIDQEKLETLSDFIDAMTIRDNKPDYFNPGMFPDVYSQYTWNAIADRAINPEKDLLPVNDYLKAYLTPPEQLSVKAKPYLEKLDKLFGSCQKNKDSHEAILSDMRDDEKVLSDSDKTNKIAAMNKISTDVEFFISNDADFKTNEIEDM